MAATLRKPVVNAQGIKCTNCGAAIDIAHAADHICRTGSPAPMHPMDRFNQAFSSMKTKTNAPFPFDIRPRAAPSTGPSVSNPNRLPQPSPVNINPVGDRVFQPRPSSPQEPRFDRAVTPGPLHAPGSPFGALPPFRIPPRAATASPRPPLRDPSPDRALPQECAFPAFPLTRHGAPSGKGNTDKARSGTPTTQSEATTPRPETPEQHILGLPPGLRPVVQDRNLVDTDRSTRSSILSRTDASSEYDTAPPIPMLSERRKLASPGRPDTMRLPFTSSPQDQDREIYPSPNQSPEATPTSPKRALGHFRKPSMSAASRPLHEIGCIKSHRPALSRSGSQHRFGRDLGAPLSAKVVHDRSDSRLENAPPVPAQRFLQEHAIRTDIDANGTLTHSPTGSVSSNASSAPTSSSRSSPPTSAMSLGPGHKPFESIEERSGDFCQSSTREFLSAPNNSGFRSHAPPPLSIRDGTRDFMPPPLSARTAPNPDLPEPLSPPRGPFGTPLQQAFDDSPHSEGYMPPLRSPLQHDFNNPLHPVYTGGQNQHIRQHSGYEPTAVEMPGREQGYKAPSQAATRRRPVKSFSRPNYARPGGMSEPESPMDPALQNGRWPALNIETCAPVPSSRWDTPPQTAPLTANRPDWAPPPLRSPQTAPAMENEEMSPRRDVFPPRNQSIHRSHRFHTPNPIQPDPTFHRTPTTRRALCRGCNQYIHGKSVSSADGQLTGRWHRSCFVCRTCSSPFASSDFYVFQDDPYCARHYHKLNNTLCCACDCGIEGQYVETDAQIKFHPHCFTCRECHLILRDEHYEDPQSGAILCEQHAMDSWRRQFGENGDFESGLGAGSRFPERRTTRLMMI